MTVSVRTRRVGPAVVLVMLLTACSSPETGERDAGGVTGQSHESSFGHVHGLAVNPADERLYVATHLGVFRRTDEGFERIADRWQDTMAFTVAGPDRFLASGHPDLREDKPSHLGLIESTDAAETWQPLSLEGEADFHDLEVAGDRVYGYDSLTGTLKVTEDRRTWSDVLAAPLLDVEADPADPESLLMSDQRGELVRLRTDGEPERVDGGPRVGFISWPTPELVVGLGASGEVWVSRDRGGRWERAGEVPGSPQAVAVDGGEWYAATDQGVFSSTDDGGTWEPVT